MATEPPYAVELLKTAKHDRRSFDCGVESLNRYFREQASQDVKRRAAGCWVLLQVDRPRDVCGYYTLSSESVELREVEAVSPELLKKLPRYPRLGAILLGRLAVDRSQHGKGCGELLLHDAMLRTLQADIPAILMVTDPKDEKAVAFYKKYGFDRLSDTRLFTTMQRIADTLGSRD